MKAAIRGRRVLAAVLSCLMVLLAGQPARAATTRALTGVTVRVGVTISPGDTLPEITILQADTTKTQDYPAYAVTNSDKYAIRYAEWITSEDQYIGIGDQPRMRVYLEITNSDYAFRGSYGSSNVTIRGGTMVSARRETNDELAVVITLNGVKGQYYAPVSAEWRDGAYGRAVWNQDYDLYDEYISSMMSGYYDVYLYRGNTVVHKVEDYHGTSYNFYPYMTRKGTYYFRVRSVPHTEDQKKYGTKSEWMDSDEIYLDEEDVSDGSGQTNVDNVAAGTTQIGWIKSNGDWYFRYPNGQYQTNGWLKLNGIWYLFDSSGRMMTGWQQVKGLWYYMQTNGAMQTGWIKAGNSWYYLNTVSDGVEGAMHTGWLAKGGKTYYLDGNGVMLEGWHEINKKYYYFYPGYGYMATNTTIDTYFQVGADGAWIQ